MSKAKPELKLVEDTGSQLLAEELIPELPPQQSEMPFAVVEGEPVTQLPRDLYIPPDALQVFLEAFEGPLDLLLYLIRKQNLDILDIPIAEITRQYMKYIEVMADLQLELAGEYLLMAAMLAEIKSRMLLPRPPSAEGQDEDDPRAELVRRLQEYERFKKAAEDLDQLPRLERDNMPATAELQERKVVKMLPDVTLQEMLLAFKDVLSRAEKFAHHHISRERLSQRERMSDILSRLQNAAFFEFSQLFKVEEGRMGVTVTFIAILELMKEGLIEIVQAEAYAPIHVRTAQGARQLKVVPGGEVADADAENQAALAQPELAGENDIVDEEELIQQAAVVEEAAEVPVDADAENQAALAQPELPGENDLSDDERPSAEDSFAGEPAEIVEAHLDADSVEVIVVDVEAESDTAPELSSERELLDQQTEAPDALAANEHFEVADTPIEEVMSDEPIVVDAHVEAMVSETAPDAQVEAALAQPAQQAEDELIAESADEVDALAADGIETAASGVQQVSSDESVVVEVTAVETFVADADAEGDVAEEAAPGDSDSQGQDEIVAGSAHESDSQGVEQFESTNAVVNEVSSDELAVVEVTETETFVADVDVEAADEEMLAAPEEQGDRAPLEESLTAEHLVAVDMPVQEVASDEPIVVDAEGDAGIVTEARDETDASAEAESEASLAQPELPVDQSTDDEALLTAEPAPLDTADSNDAAAQFEEHSIEQHVVAEHLVEENVVEEHVVEQHAIETPPVSGDDDEVTGSLSGADNPDAEPSR